MDTNSYQHLLTLGHFIICYHTYHLSWDDMLNGLAVVFLLAYVGTWQAVGPYVYGLQLFSLGLSPEPPDVVLDSKTVTNYNIANTLLFWCVIYSVKASLLALYWRIFRVSVGFRRAWWLATAYTTLAFFITFLWGFWQCGAPKDFLNDGRSPANILVPHM